MVEHPPSMVPVSNAIGYLETKPAALTEQLGQVDAELDSVDLPSSSANCPACG